MKFLNVILVWIITISFALAVSPIVLAADDSNQGKQKPKDGPVIETSNDLEYIPPIRGAPGRRMSAGTRGGADALSSLFVLAPDHVGLTIQEQPSLYWFISDSSRYPVEFSISEVSAVKPLLETRVAPPIPPGIYCIRLADYGIRLRTGVHYRWFVSIIPDPEQRSKDIVAGGEIERTDLQETVRSQLQQAGSGKKASVYAKAGLWYDAISALSDLIAASPGDEAAYKQRASLLRKVGLETVAKHK